MGRGELGVLRSTCIRSALSTEEVARLEAVEKGQLGG